MEKRSIQNSVGIGGDTLRIHEAAHDALELPERVVGQDLVALAPLQPLLAHGVVKPRVGRDHPEGFANLVEGGEQPPGEGEGVPPLAHRALVDGLLKGDPGPVGAAHLFVHPHVAHRGKHVQDRVRDQHVGDDVLVADRTHGVLAAEVGVGKALAGIRGAARRLVAKVHEAEPPGEAGKGPELVAAAPQQLLPLDVAISRRHPAEATTRHRDFGELIPIPEVAQD